MVIEFNLFNYIYKFYGNKVLYKNFQPAIFETSQLISTRQLRQFKLSSVQNEPVSKLTSARQSILVS